MLSSPCGLLSNKAAPTLQSAPAPCQPLLIHLRLSWDALGGQRGLRAKGPSGPAKAMVPGEWAAVQSPGAGWLIADAQRLPWTVTQAPDSCDL